MLYIYICIYWTLLDISVYMHLAYPLRVYKSKVLPKFSKL